MPKLTVLSNVAVLVLVLEGRSMADPDRVVLADSDPELLHAIESSLSPWHLTIIVDARTVDEKSAAERADAAGARFLVWREGNDLVVYDRTSNLAERRPARAGAFDNVSAAAAALTVKTMMRLPPPEQTQPHPPGASGVARERRTGWRLEAGGAARVSPSSDASLAGRLLMGAMIQPSALPAWRFGLRGDVGTESSIDRSGATGSWNDWSAIAAASYSLSFAPWEIEPWLGLGMTRGSLDVVDATTPRHDRSTLFDTRAGVVGRRRFGSLTTGLDLSLSWRPGAPRYTKMTMGMGTPTVFEAPKFSIVFGIVVAVDLGG